MNHNKKANLRKEIISGLIWSVVMIFVFAFLDPIVTERDIDWRGMRFKVPLWLIIGIGLGFINYNRKKNKNG